MSDKPKVSDRMFNLVIDFGADCINYGCNQLRPMVGYPLIENVQHRKKESALCSAIAEIEQRVEKWKAVALTHVTLIQSLSGSVDEINVASKKAVEACKALGDEWEEAVTHD